MCPSLLASVETHLGQSKVQQHFLIHFQQMNLEDELVVASVHRAHRHLAEGGAVSTGWDSLKSTDHLEAEA